MTDYATEKIVQKLLDRVKQTNCGINQIAYHQEWYENKEEKDDRRNKSC